MSEQPFFDEFFVLCAVFRERDVSACFGHLKRRILLHEFDSCVLVFVLYGARQRSIPLEVLLREQTAVILGHAILKRTCVLTLVLERLVQVVARTLGLL